MKKKNIIIIASLLYTFILLGILGYRIYLICSDTSGLYELKDNSFVFFTLTFLPEIAIITTMLATNIKKGLGVVLTFIAGVLTISAFVVELFIKIVKSVDMFNESPVPPSLVPWLNIPVFIIVVILFIVKFHILTIPKEVKLKRKKKR